MSTVSIIAVSSATHPSKSSLSCSCSLYLFGNPDLKFQPLKFREIL